MARRILAWMVVLISVPAAVAAQLCVFPAPGDTVWVETKVTAAPSRPVATPSLEEVRWEGRLDRLTEDSVFVRLAHEVRGALIPWNETRIQAHCYVGTNGLVSSTHGATEGRWVWRDVKELLSR